MSLYTVKGTITSCKTNHTHDKVEVEWEIADFFSLGRCIKEWDSPPFKFLNTECCLRMCIKEKVDVLPYRGSLYLVMRNLSSLYSVTFTLGIRHQSKPVQFGPVTRLFDKNNTSYGEEDLFAEVLLSLNRTNKYGSTLVVYCNAAETQSGTGCHTTSLYSTTTLCRHFLDLLLSGQHSDVTIAVCDREFKVHKNILGARSPVFAAMFEHDMLENKENVVKVEDCDPVTFQKFLQCVYAGSVENLSVDEAIRLYIVSHKYTVVDVMEHCARFLEEELSEAKVLDILTLAHRYKETDLQSTAKKFLTENLNKVLSSNDWSKLMTESSLLQKYTEV